MPAMQLELGEDLVALLRGLNRPVEEAARELIVLELYRRELVSSGKAAELLGISKVDFIQRAAALGIPYFRMSADEVKADADRIRNATA
jgi:predicted HTH domain antitoxin